MREIPWVGIIALGLIAIGAVGFGAAAIWLGVRLLCAS